MIPYEDFSWIYVVDITATQLASSEMIKICKNKRWKHVAYHDQNNLHDSLYKIFDILENVGA